MRFQLLPKRIRSGLILRFSRDVGTTEVSSLRITTSNKEVDQWDLQLHKSLPNPEIIKCIIAQFVPCYTSVARHDPVDSLLYVIEVRLITRELIEMRQGPLERSVFVGHDRRSGARESVSLPSRDGGIGKPGGIPDCRQR
jgi:hypothetical protein